MGFKEFENLCFRDCGAGQSAILLSTSILLSTCYTYISFILTRNWTCKDSLESSFNVECSHGMR